MLKCVLIINCPLFRCSSYRPFSKCNFSRELTKNGFTYPRRIGYNRIMNSFTESLGIPLHIVVIDSGIGGLPYLAAIRQQLTKLSIPHQLSYIADNAGFPYGTKSRDELRDHLDALSKHIADALHPDAVVIACNTASVTALDLFKANLPQAFIVATTPPLLRLADPAYQNSLGMQKNAMLLATSGTCAIIQQQLSHPLSPDLHFYPADTLVSFVENDLLTSARNMINTELAPFTAHIQESHIEALFLGCTHFLHLKKYFVALLPDVQIIDNVDSVAHRLIDGIRLHEPHANQPTRTGFFITQNPCPPNYPLFRQRYDLPDAGVL